MEVTRESVLKATTSLIQAIPLIDFIVTKGNGYIYGGFLRWVVQHMTENGNVPTVKDMYENLKNGSDIDISIKSDRRRNTTFKEILVRVVEEGGYIELSTRLYDSSKKYNINPREIDIYMGLYYGCYLIWLPIPDEKDSFMRLEILFEERNSELRDVDYCVNNMKFGYNINEKIYWINPKTGFDKIIEFIHNKIFTMGFYWNEGISDQEIMRCLKRIYRVKKLWKRGYRPAMITVFTECINSILVRAKNCNEPGSYICIDDISIPSVMEDNTMLHSTTHDYARMDFKLFMQDDYMQKICINLGIDLDEINNDNIASDSED